MSLSGDFGNDEMMSVLQNKKIRLGIGVAAVVLALAALGAGTYAAFLDKETGPGGSTSSGTLDLTVGSTGTTQLFSATNIAPGYTQDVVYSLKHIGSLPGTLTSTLKVTGAAVTCTEPEAPTTPFTLTQIATNGLPSAGVVAAGATVDYGLRFTFPDLAGTENNKAQGDSVTLSSDFLLTQSP